MALNGCYSCLKFLVFTINFILWLLGLGVVAVSLWLLFDEHLYLQTMSDQRTDYYLGTYIILGIGSLVTIMGFLGCCGAWKESPWMLGTFFAFLMIIFFGEVASGVLVYYQESNYESMIDKSVRNTVELQYNSSNVAVLQTFDLLQEGLECCGVEGPKDWQKSVYNKHDFSANTELGVGSTETEYNIPTSCCKAPESQDCRKNIVLKSKQLPDHRFIYMDGCADKLKTFLKDHLIYLLAAGMGIVLAEIMGMLCSLCLCCALKRIDDLKA